MHREHAVGALIRVRFPAPEPLVPEAAWLIEGAGFEPAAGGAVGGALRNGGRGGVWRGGTGVQLRRLRTLPDTVASGMGTLVCGLNPSLVSSDAGFGFAGATNRFWNAALSSGLVQVARRPLDALLLDGVGMTDVVKRATARSHHLDPAEYGVGLARLEHMVGWLKPGVVLFVGLEGWRAAVDRKVLPGFQARGIAGRPAYVMPSTSGANARTSAVELSRHMRAALDGPA
jgi:TDG/mug DNA glycosylase family protein